MNVFSKEGLFYVQRHYLDLQHIAHFVNIFTSAVK